MLRGERSKGGGRGCGRAAVLPCLPPCPTLPRKTPSAPRGNALPSTRRAVKGGVPQSCGDVHRIQSLGLGEISGAILLTQLLKLVGQAQQNIPWATCSQHFCGGEGLHCTYTSSWGLKETSSACVCPSSCPRFSVGPFLPLVSLGGCLEDQHFRVYWAHLLLCFPDNFCFYFNFFLLYSFLILFCFFGFLRGTHTFQSSVLFSHKHTEACTFSSVCWVHLT